MADGPEWEDETMAFRAEGIDHVVVRGAFDEVVCKKALSPVRSVGLAPGQSLATTPCNAARVT